MLRPITDDWSLDIDEDFRHTRDEDKNLVFWKGPLTVYVAVWKRPGSETKEQTLAWIKSEAASDPLKQFSCDDDTTLRYGYLLWESEDGDERYGFYGFAVADNSYVQMSAYYDVEGDLAWAKSVWESLAYKR